MYDKGTYVSGDIAVELDGRCMTRTDGHAKHLAAMMWEWRRPDEMALSRKPLSNGSKTGLLERQFDRVIIHAPFRFGPVRMAQRAGLSMTRFVKRLRSARLFG